MKKNKLPSAHYPNHRTASGGVVSSGRQAIRSTRTYNPSRNGKVKRQVLADIIRRVVEAAQPEKIILFGSAARGEMGPNSDVDLLVIKGGKFNRDRLVDKIYDNLYGADAAVDVILVTPEEVERYRDTHCLVICPAVREGKVVYGA